MAIIGHGVDIVEISRIRTMVGEHPERFLDRVYSEQERLDSGTGKRRDEHLAVRFAAKEAAMKTLGTGWSQGIGWTDVSVVKDEAGKPSLVVVGKAAEIAAELGITAWHVSLSHTDTHAIASVIAEGA
ncbi:MAG: holo-ACP synthase [Phycisphaerales bacterium]|nr:holo-ACP synthase [Phycisphaerales bacterium]